MIGWSGLGLVITTAILALWFLKDGNRDALMDLLAHFKWNWGPPHPSGSLWPTYFCWDCLKYLFVLWFVCGVDQCGTPHFLLSELTCVSVCSLFGGVDQLGGFYFLSRPVSFRKHMQCRVHIHRTVLCSVISFLSLDGIIAGVILEKRGVY